MGQKGRVFLQAQFGLLSVYRPNIFLMSDLKGLMRAVLKIPYLQG